LEVKLDLLTRIQTLFILALGAGIGIIPMTCQFEHVMRISSEYSADEEFISVTPSSADGVYQADGLIPEELRKVLIKGVYAFENVDKSKFDRLPGSNEQVLDLVHPSLFCYVIDLTIIQRGIWPEPRSDFLGSGVSEEVTEKKKGLLSSIIGSTKKVWQAFKTNAAYRVHRAGISKNFNGYRPSSCWTTTAKFRSARILTICTQSYTKLCTALWSAFSSSLSRCSTRP
jgi:hypothetical protein